MSVTFSPDLKGDLPTLEPCLCTQMSPSFSDWMQYGPAAPEVMRGEAWPDCGACRGAGVEHGTRAAYPELNFSNDNAMSLLRAMNLPAEYSGEMTIAQARRGVMRARARKSLMPFTRPRLVSERFFDFGSSSGDVEERLNRFANFVELGASLGATKISWY